MIALKRNKTLKLLLFLIVILAGLISCGNKKEEVKKAASERSKSQNKDEAGKYSRIIVIDPAAVEMIYMLGGEDRIVAIAKLEKSKIWPEEKTEKLESVGTFINPSLEKIVALKPDLVIASFHTTDALEKNLKSHGIELKKVQAASIEDIFNNLKQIAGIIGKEAEAEKIITEKRQKIEEIKKMETTERKGLFVIAPTPMRVFGKGTLPDDILTMLNVRNIAAGLEGVSPTLTPEYIIKENPDIILTFVKNPEEIAKANPQLKDVDAIKNRKYIVLETNQILRGSPRTIDHISDVYSKVKEQVK